MAAEEYNAFFYTLVSTVSNLFEDVSWDKKQFLLESNCGPFYVERTEPTS